MCLSIPGEVVAIDDRQAGVATVNVGGVPRAINIGLLDDVAPGDWVLVHVGFAMSKIDEAEAAAVLQLLDSIATA